MPAGLGIGEDARDEKALVDLDALFVLERDGALGSDRGQGGNKTGDKRSGLVRKVLDADEAREIAGQPAIKPGSMGGQEPLARCPVALDDDRGGVALGLAPRRLPRQRPEQRAAFGPQRGEGGGVALE